MVSQVRGLTETCRLYAIAPQLQTFMMFLDFVQKRGFVSDRNGTCFFIHSHTSVTFGPLDADCQLWKRSQILREGMPGSMSGFPSAFRFLVADLGFS